jgi:flagellar export protein FliJ
MPVSKALRRLLRIRDLEEEQRRNEYEAALGDLNRLRGALTATDQRERNGHRLVNSSSRSGEITDRLAGYEEIKTSQRIHEILIPRVISQEKVAIECQAAYLEKRIERRQAETLIEEAEARESLEADRRTQQMLDDWFNSRPAKDKEHS